MGAKKIRFDIWGTQMNMLQTVVEEVRSLEVGIYLTKEARDSLREQFQFHHILISFKSCQQSWLPKYTHVKSGTIYTLKERNSALQ